MSETKTEQALSAVETSELRYLEPQTLRFFRHGAALRLTICSAQREADRSYPRVSVLRAFPLSEPNRYLSVRYGEKKEVGMIVEPSALDAESRKLVAEELTRRYLVPEIRRVRSIKERFGTVDWDVETSRGSYRFTTRNLRDKAVQPSPGRYLIEDVDGNRYDIPDLSMLDLASQNLLLRHL